MDKQTISLYQKRWEIETMFGALKTPPLLTPLCVRSIITSQLPVKEWYDILNNPTIADLAEVLVPFGYALLDRIVHSSHRIELEGDSMRKSKALTNDFA